MRSTLLPWNNLANYCPYIVLLFLWWFSRSFTHYSFLLPHRYFPLSLSLCSLHCFFFFSFPLFFSSSLTVLIAGFKNTRPFKRKHKHLHSLTQSVFLIQARNSFKCSLPITSWGFIFVRLQSSIFILFCQPVMREGMTIRCVVGPLGGCIKV